MAAKDAEKAAKVAARSDAKAAKAASRTDAKAAKAAARTEAKAAKLPFEPAAREVLEGERPNALPLVPWMPDVFAVVAPVLNKVVSGELSSEEGAAQLQSAAEKAIDDSGYGS